MLLCPLAVSTASNRFSSTGMSLVHVAKASALRPILRPFADRKLSPNALAPTSVLPPRRAGQPGTISQGLDLRVHQSVLAGSRRFHQRSGPHHPRVTCRHKSLEARLREDPRLPGGGALSHT